MYSSRLTLAAALLAFLLPCLPVMSVQADSGKVVVANRASGTISVIDTHTDTVTATVPLPAGVNAPEPMYVVYSPTHHRVFVNDRSNNRVVAFDARTFALEATIPSGAGGWHAWGDIGKRQLWVANDIDDTATVIDMGTLEVLATVPMPSDLAVGTGRPHDVILDPTAPFAYVTMIGVVGPDDYVVMFSTESFAEVARAPVDKDPHVSLARQDALLYVACQGGGVVSVLDRTTLDPVADIPVPNAHGAGMTRNGKVFYTTNIAGGGPGGLVTIDTSVLAVLGTTDTPFTIPHNIALTPNSRKVYVTHSGANNQVTVYEASMQNPVPGLLGSVMVGSNPFGLAYVP